jgi:hypothetical protein
LIHVRERLADKSFRRAAGGNAFDGFDKKKPGKGSREKNG